MNIPLRVSAWRGVGKACWGRAGSRGQESPWEDTGRLHEQARLCGWHSRRRGQQVRRPSPRAEVGLCRGLGQGRGGEMPSRLSPVRVREAATVPSSKIRKLKHLSDSSARRPALPTWRPAAVGRPSGLAPREGEATGTGIQAQPTLVPPAPPRRAIRYTREL